MVTNKFIGAEEIILKLHNGIGKIKENYHCELMLTESVIIYSIYG